MPLRTVRIDPRDFIGPPYRVCPSCQREAFGVVGIHGTSYTRRCRECLTSKNLPLWPVKKRVLYIDQFAISNMMKVLDGEARAHERVKTDPFWTELFHALERVCRLQLATCPDSQAHHHESLLSPFYEPLKRMYEHLSRGVTFQDSGFIARKQLAAAAAAWLKGEAPVYDLNPERVTSGQLHEWHDRYLITVQMPWPEDIVEGIRQFRDRVHEQLITFSQKVRNSSEKSFRYWYLHERNNGGRNGVLGAVERYVESLKQMSEFDYDKVHDSEGLDRFRVIESVFKSHGVQPADFGPKLHEFLDSDAFRDYPYSAIESRIWGVLCQQFANGRRQPIDQGTANDISVISSLLPFCDAMFVDDRCRALLAAIPKRYALPYETKVFSTNTREEFLRYLKGIEEEADPTVLAHVRDVYGEDATAPYTSLYDDERRREGRRQKDPADPSE